MDFTENQPIYKQIIDFCYGRIVSGEWSSDSRIPSTKDLSATLAVNNRTVLKAYDDMHAMGVIFQRRGLGYFVSADARRLIIESRRRDFFERAVPQLAAQMKLLELSIDDLTGALQNAIHKPD